MTKTAYMQITGCSGIISVNTEASFSAITSSAVIECTATTLELSDAVDVDLGYTDDHRVVLSGFVKRIELQKPDRIYRVTVNDLLIRAVDYFMASDDPKAPLQFNNTQDKDLVNGLLSQAGLPAVVSATPTPTFTFGSNADGARFNLQSVSDAVQFVCNVTGRHCYADAGNIYYIDRKPYVDTGDTSSGTWTNTGAGRNIISISKESDSSKIRDRVVVYGKTPIRSIAEDPSPYTVVRQTACIAHELIDLSSLADRCADVNLQIMRRLNPVFTIDLIGDANIMPRRCYLIQESFTGMNDLAFCYRVSHNISSAGFVTSVTAIGVDIND